MKANTPQSALRAVICRHGFGGAHTQRSPEREQKRARRQSAFPEPPSPARPREGPSRRCPGGRGEPGAESGEIAPCTPQALPQSTRGRRGSPRGYAWWQGDAGLPVPRRTARPSRPRGWHRPQPPGEESWGSEFTLSPSPPLPPAGTGAMAPRPACGGPAVSLVEPRRCRAAAITRAKTRPPSRHPPPQRGNAAAAGVCERKESGGEWGAKRWPRLWEKAGLGGDGAEAGLHHTLPGLASHASPRLPRALQARAERWKRRFSPESPSPHPTSSLPGPGLAVLGTGAWGTRRRLPAEIRPGKVWGQK